MWRVSCLLCLLLFYYVDENSAQVSHPYIVSIKLKLQEEEIPRLIAESLSGNNTILAPYFDYSHVSFNDFAEIIGTRNVTLRKVFKLFDIELTDFSDVIPGKTLIEIVEVANINVHHLYSMFVQYFLTNPVNDVQSILDCLNIDQDKFTMAVVFGTDKELLEILLQGSFNKKNVEEALEVVNQDVTLKEALNFLKYSRCGEALLKIKNTNSTARIIDTLKSLLVTDKVLKFINLLNISANDFYQNEAFSVLLTNVVDTKEELVGSVVSPSSIITNRDSKTLIDYNYLKNYTRLVATFIEKPDLQHIILDTKRSTSTILTTLLILDKLELEEYLNLSSNIDTGNLLNCTYISLNILCNTSFYIENVTANLDKNDHLIINKTNSTIFHVGSPLVCGQYLYGVADWESDSTISFIKINSPTQADNNPPGYLSVVINFVTQVRTVVVGSVCTVLEFLNFDICSDKFVAGA